MKKALVTLIITILSLLTLTALFVVIIDPFFHYHKNLGNRVYLYNEVYQSPGMARTFSYDTVMLGSSMTENFKVSQFDEYDQKAVKLCYSGARSKDIGRLLNEVFKSKNYVNRIYIDLNDYQLCSEPDSEYGIVPKYLYDNNVFNDVWYIYNKDVIYECINALVNPNVNNLENAYTWTDETLFGKDKVLENLASSHTDEAWIAPDNSSADKNDNMRDIVCRNMDNITQYVKAHPKTEFIFFYPPYSAAYWYDIKSRGELDEKINMYEISMEQLFSYDNVRVYFFMDDYETTDNLDNYRDICHFNADINAAMLHDMNEGNCEIDVSTYKARLANLKDHANHIMINKM